MTAPRLDLSPAPRRSVRIARAFTAREVVDITIPGEAGDQAAVDYVLAAIRAGQPLDWKMDVSEAVRSPEVSILMAHQEELLPKNARASRAPDPDDDIPF